MEHPKQSEALTACPGCGARVPPSDGPTHAYIGASPECWAAFGGVLAKEFSDEAHFSVHQFTVDAYAAQHPGEPSRRSIQSVAVHLIGLYQAIDLGWSAEKIIKARKAMSKSDLLWLDPPPATYAMTILDVAGVQDAQDHARRVRAWAQAVWQHWEAHHATILGWAGRQGQAT